MSGQLSTIKAALNKKVFRCFLNVDNVEQDVTSRGSVPEVWSSHTESATAVNSPSAARFQKLTRWWSKRHGSDWEPAGQEIVEVARLTGLTNYEYVKHSYNKMWQSECYATIIAVLLIQLKRSRSDRPSSINVIDFVPIKSQYDFLSVINCDTICCISQRFPDLVLDIEIFYKIITTQPHFDPSARGNGIPFEFRCQTSSLKALSTFWATFQWMMTKSIPRVTGDERQTDVNMRTLWTLSISM